MSEVEILGLVFLSSIGLFLIGLGLSEDEIGDPILLVILLGFAALPLSIVLLVRDFLGIH